MEQNIFQNYQEKKAQIRVLASEALKGGWINQTTHDDILKKINEDKLIIGVIGQMKCGKSTFLNSFLFGRPLLPAATTPMTAALSVITYGDRKGLEAEFYTQNEWDELRALAERDESAVTDSQTKSSIKAAKELYTKSRPIMSQLPKLLGKTQNDDFDNLIEYVGADGKYVSIVKSVRITLPEEWLKGVEIVDTPGFNDPVVSREERTKEFLKKADVVLMMLYAGRAFDSTDRDILFEKVRRVGVGKIILAVNKYELQRLKNESPEQIKENVSDEIRKAIRFYKDESLNELLEDLDPILISALMALLAKMPIAQINADETLKYHYDEACNNFEVDSQQQLLKLSRISDLEEKVRDIIVNQKEKILIEKPKNLILAKAKNLIDEITTNLELLHQKKENLSLPDDELEEKISNLEKAQRRIERKIKHAEFDLAEIFDEESKKLFRNLQDLADDTKKECDRIIDSNKGDSLHRQLDARLERFKDREFSRYLKDINKTLQRTFGNSLNNLNDDIVSILRKYIDDTDEISKTFIRTMKEGLTMETRDDYFTEGSGLSSGEDSSFLDLIFEMPILPKALVTFFHTGRDEAREKVKYFFDSIDWDSMEHRFNERKQKFISTLGGDAANSLIGDLVEQAKEAIGTKEEKEKALEATKDEIERKTAELDKLKESYNHIKELTR